MSFDLEQADAAADIMAALANCAITVTARLGGTIDATSGQYAGQTVTTVTGVSACRSERSTEVIGASFGPVDAEEVMYAILADAIDPLTPREGLYVVDGSQTRRVTRVERGMNNGIIGLVARSDRRA